MLTKKHDEIVREKSEYVKYLEVKYSSDIHKALSYIEHNAGPVKRLGKNYMLKGVLYTKEDIIDLWKKAVN